MDDNWRYIGRHIHRGNGDRASGRRIGSYLNSLRDGREAGSMRDTAHLSVCAC